MINKDEILVNRPELEDRERINDFFKLVLEDTFEQNGYQDLMELLDEEIVEKRKCLDQDFDTDGSERFFLLAQSHGKIIGTVEFGRANDLIHQCTNGELKDLYEIGTVFVHPQYQRQGVVSLMFQELVLELENRGVSDVCFDSGYKIAQKIWTKKFGAPAYFLNDFWGEGCHHMVWKVEITEFAAR